MNISASAVTAAILFAALCAGAHAQPPASAAPPSKNPFDRPRGIVAVSSVAPAAPEPAPDFELRTTLTGPGRAMANIDGVILSLGERYFEYRVAAIGEARVVLVKGDERLVLDLRDDEAAQDQRR